MPTVRSYFGADRIFRCFNNLQLAHGADPTMKNQEGQTALDLATVKSYCRYILIVGCVMMSTREFALCVFIRYAYIHVLRSSMRQI